MATNTFQNTVFYGRFLLFIAGMGGLLYGIDVGIIAGALLYLEKTISLTVEQTSIHRGGRVGRQYVFFARGWHSG